MEQVRMTRRQLATASRLAPDQLDQIQGTFDIDGKRYQWVGFGFVEHGDADGSEAVVVTDDPPQEEPKKRGRR